MREGKSLSSFIKKAIRPTLLGIAVFMLFYFLFSIGVGLIKKYIQTEIKEVEPEVVTEGDISIEDMTNNEADDETIDTNTAKEQEYFYFDPENKPESVEIVIYKGERILELIGDGETIGRFPIGLGGHPEGDKLEEGDQKTPEGMYYICSRNPKSSYTLSMGISYPNIEDADRGIKAGIIDDKTKDRIVKAINSGRRPPWDTTMGGEIFIHGKGSSSDWTLGCIALDDDDIRILWEWGALGVMVEILP